MKISGPTSPSYPGEIVTQEVIDYIRKMEHIEQHHCGGEAVTCSGSLISKDLAIYTCQITRGSQSTINFLPEFWGKRTYSRRSRSERSTDLFDCSVDIRKNLNFLPSLI